MNGKKEDIFMLVFVISFIVSVFFLCAGRTSVHDLRERTQPLGTELGNARQEQQKQSETLEKAERATGTSREAVKDSKRFNQTITDTEREDETIIRECQSILRTVRERGRTEDSN